MTDEKAKEIVSYIMQNCREDNTLNVRRYSDLKDDYSEFERWEYEEHKESGRVMTPEDAAEIIQNLKLWLRNAEVNEELQMSIDIYEALDMAIKVMKEEK